MLMELKRNEIWKSNKSLIICLFLIYTVAYHPGSPAVCSPRANYTSPTLCNHGNIIDEDDNEEDVPREKFKKVVVKQESKEVHHSYSALVEEGESPSPRLAHCRFVWNNCDNERDRVERYAQNTQQSFYTTEGWKQQIIKTSDLLFLGDACPSIHILSRSKENVYHLMPLLSMLWYISVKPLVILIWLIQVNPSELSALYMTISISHQHI